ncbi:PREDICTED: uncharacterized protein LOC109147018 [Ipomoea nil]|uniref:uncharacterized protein LOC109147018 n=1 Tax=Ipomoea nil TaxID=35883 RepID=UPI0009015E42|nr:PREDICTED: uncharacterized protein LOC109147018 [Ipomoea nil]
MGGKIDKSVNNGSAPPIFKIHGQNFHRIGSLLPPDGSQPKFAQLYIHDTQNEIQNRIASVRENTSRQDLHVEVVEDIRDVLDENNVLVKSFRMARSEIDRNPRVDIKMRLIEVATLIVSDLDPSMGHRDILVECKSGGLQRINELNPSYIPLQYPILFPYGEDGFREDIQFATRTSSSTNARKRISQREFFAFRIHERLDELSTILYARRLFQQFIVDAYTLVESARLIYIRTHQKSLRCEALRGLTNALTRGETKASTQGKRILLPSSFTGGARYMIQNYQEAMVICRHIGYPNLFVTFTCNPKWPEIQRYITKRNLHAEDRLDIVCRVFKMKLDCLIKEFKHGELFGPVKSVIYTIEFQKRGLPHAHILIFLKNKGDMSSPTYIDSIIKAEIPDTALDMNYYNAVEEFMVHGPCGLARKNSPCMVNGKCSKHFPKKFANESQFDHEGYPVYRRRDDGKTIKKNDLVLTEVEKQNFGLMELDKLLMVHNKSLIDFLPMPTPNLDGSRAVENILLFEELNYDRTTLKLESEKMSKTLTDEQREIFETIIQDVMKNKGGLFFVYGYGGTGKTFLWKTLSAALRAKAINSSYLWDSCKVLRLTKNLRLNRVDPGVDIKQLEEFANWIASIGDGIVDGHSDGNTEIVIPHDRLLPSDGDPITTIVESTFPMIMSGNADSSLLEGRAILAPTLDVVNSINEYMSDLHIGVSRTYYSCDSVCRSESNSSLLDDVHTP